MFSIQYKGIKITKCKKYINLKQNKKTPPKTKTKTNKQPRQKKKRKKLPPCYFEYLYGPFG
jgi:hypothetical protein